MTDRTDEDRGAEEDSTPPRNGLAERMQWEEGDFQVIPATTDTPEYRLANLDRYPAHYRKAVENDARRAIAQREARG